MNLFVTNGEKVVKQWEYDTGTEESKTKNTIAVTTKRFIYHTETESDDNQKRITRYETALKYIKSVDTSYARMPKSSLGFLLIVLASVLMGIFLILTVVNFNIAFVVLIALSAILLAIGISVHKSAKERSQFMLSFETINPEGNGFAIGGSSLLPGLPSGKRRNSSKKGFNGLVFILLLAFCFPVAIIYFLSTAFKKSGKKSSSNPTFEISQEVAIDIISTLGLLCLNSDMKKEQ